LSNKRDKPLTDSQVKKIETEAEFKITMVLGQENLEKTIGELHETLKDHCKTSTPFRRDVTALKATAAITVPILIIIIGYLIKSH